MEDMLLILQDSKNWSDIYSKLILKDTKVSGRLFEEFCKYYYLCEPSVKREYKNVWLFSEVPEEIKWKLNLGKIDHGVDLVLEDMMNNFSVVQCKFRTDQETSITWTKDKLSNVFGEGHKADVIIIFTNASKLDNHSKSKRPNQLKVVTLGDLIQISETMIQETISLLDGISKKPIIIKEPFAFQKDVIRKVEEGFKQYDRGQLVLPCGAGKTLTSLWIRQSLGVNSTLVLVPSLALLRQTKNVWHSNSSEFIPYILVCSENDIDKGYDCATVHTFEINGRVTTDHTEIEDFLKLNEKCIIYSTYQSLDSICIATKAIDYCFDLAICDEAHKTAGHNLSKFGLIHLDSNIFIRKRLYMTATPRIMSDNLKSKNLEYLYNMSDEKIYGPEFYRMSFKQAIEQGILVNYQIKAIGISDKDLEKAIKERRLIADEENIYEIANNFALNKFMEQYEASHAITFHSSVKKALSFQNRHKNTLAQTNTYHVNGSMTTNNRQLQMKKYEESRKSVMTNARCLSEGVDMPVVDIVCFCDPKNSKIEIVQAVGRALRKAEYKKKKFGYILIPIFHREKDKLEEIIASGPFDILLKVVRAMCSHDERLIDEIKNIRFEFGKNKFTLKSINIKDNHQLIHFENFSDQRLSDDIFFQTVNKIRVPWKIFHEAKIYAQSLKLKSVKEWRDYCESGNKPDDIPYNPDVVYKEFGWKEEGGWYDWLGKGNGKVLPFKEARSIVWEMKLKNQNEWRNYCRSENKRKDIPSDPAKVYKNDGWNGSDDWLGTGKTAPQNFLPYEEGKCFARTLKLNSKKEWDKYCKTNTIPFGIPKAPDVVYKKLGQWKDWGDWLGTDRIANQNRVWRPFVEARAYIWSLGFTSETQWHIFRKSGDRPKDIPTNPHRVYKEEWRGIKDWLGLEASVSIEKISCQ